MIVVSVKCADHRVYVGPVSTYYEFTSGPGNFTRMTDEEWKQVLLSGDHPKEPSWTADHRQPGPNVTISTFAR